MKIGIIVFSQTGNTYSVAEKLQRELEKMGILAELERLKVISDKDDKDVKFEHLPDLSKYDTIIFGAPVEAFSLNSKMKAYFNKVKSLDNKKTAVFVTQHFPYRFMGGNNAIRQMKKICINKGAGIITTGIVNWSNKKREELIDQLVKRIIKSFSWYSKQVLL